MGNREFPQGAPFVWDQAERRLASRMRQADALDTKAGALAALHAVAAGVVASLAGRLPGSSRWVAVGAILGLIVSGVLAFGAFRTEAYARSPAPEEMWRFGGWSADEIQLRFLSTRFRALDWNRDKLQRKARLISSSLAGFAIVALGVAIAAVVDLV